MTSSIIAKTKNKALKDKIPFYHGKPCKNCGDTIKSIESYKCVVCFKPPFPNT